MSKIEWTNRTWNPWWGCSEIAPECGRFGPGGQHGCCYAAVFASRELHKTHTGIAHGGKWTGKFTRSSDTVWQAPFTWHAATKVFACSMSDFWHESVPLEWLDEALDVIDRTPTLIYQILTKRPANVARRLEALNRRLPRNVWLGVTIGHPRSAPLLRPLIRVDATLHFLSCEPLLGDVAALLNLYRIGWVIGGGQSGRDAAICNAEWMRHLRDRCIQTKTAFFLKQWGTWKSNPTAQAEELDPIAKGGATLDGRLWRQFPRLS